MPSLVSFSYLYHRGTKRNGRPIEIQKKHTRFLSIMLPSESDIGGTIQTGTQEAYKFHIAPSDVDRSYKSRTIGAKKLNPDNESMASPWLIQDGHSAQELFEERLHGQCHSIINKDKSCLKKTPWAMVVDGQQRCHSYFF